MKVLLKAPFSVFTGYGNDGIGLSQALERYGADVYIEPETIQAPIPQDVADLLTKTPNAPFDLIIHHINPANLDASPQLQSSGTALIGWTMWEWTNFDYHEDKDKFRKNWENYDAILVYDDVSADALREYYDGPIVKLQGGYDPSRWTRVDRDWFAEDFYFCMLGVLSPRKDPFVSIAAFTQLQNEHEDFKKHARLSLKTVDDTGLSPKISDLYENIRIFQDSWPQKIVQSFYEHQHVLLAPSRGEGKNVPALEFQTTGGVLLATNWAGHKEWLNPDYSYALDYTLENSDIYEPGTYQAKVSVEEMKEKMLHVFRNRAEVKEKAKLAAQIIPQMCSWDSVVERLFNRIRDEVPNGEEIYAQASICRREKSHGNSGNPLPDWS